MQVDDPVSFVFVSPCPRETQVVAAAGLYLLSLSCAAERSENDVSSGLLQRVAAIPDLEVTADEAAELRLATAFNFPAVLAFAGLDQWPQLRRAHLLLLQDRDPAVRRTLACSLHEVAALLGPDQALQALGSAIQVFSRSLTM